MHNILNQIRQIMKIIKLFLPFLIFLVVFTSCSNNEETPVDNGNDGNNNNEPTSITLTASILEFEIGGGTVFTVKTNSGANVTSSATIKVNGETISGNAYTTLIEGDYTATATYKELTSSSVTFKVYNAQVYTKKAVIEDYTGTWCGWCPRVGYAIELVEAASDNVIAVGVHIGDSMENSSSVAVKDAFGITGYPSAYVDRENLWSYPEPDNVAQATDLAQGKTRVGLAINSTLSGNSLAIDIQSGFVASTPGTKLVVFILEDGIVEDQGNYTSYYAGADPIVGFVHNHVLRYSATHVLGDEIDTSGGVHDHSYTVDLAANDVANNDNVNILAMLVDASGKKVLNAQYAHINENKGFDMD